MPSIALGAGLNNINLHVFEGCITILYPQEIILFTTLACDGIEYVNSSYVLADATCVIKHAVTPLLAGVPGVSIMCTAETTSLDSTFTASLQRYYDADNYRTNIRFMDSVSTKYILQHERHIIFQAFKTFMIHDTQDKITFIGPPDTQQYIIEEDGDGTKIALCWTPMYSVCHHTKSYCTQSM